MSHEIFEHTADLGIAARGDSFGAALGEAALALTSIATGRDDLRTAKADGELVFRVEAPDQEALVVAVLAELLWFLESEQTLWIHGGIEAHQDVGGWVAQANGNAVVYDPVRHGQGTEIKAITYHGLSVVHDGDWRIRVIVDI